LVKWLWRAIWREMKNDAKRPFVSDDGAGYQTIDAFLRAFSAPGTIRKRIHLVGHSTGAILLAELLDALGRLPTPPSIASCSLMAPACTFDKYREIYRPLLSDSNGPLGVDKMTIYNLSEELELGDTVTPFYRKSLLFLVSNAFEETDQAPLLGMQKFRGKFGRVPTALRIEVSDGTTRGSPRTTAAPTEGSITIRIP
jgi:hypothetical protein